MLSASVLGGMSGERERAVVPLRRKPGSFLQVRPGRRLQLLRTHFVAGRWRRVAWGGVRAQEPASPARYPPRALHEGPAGGPVQREEAQNVGIAGERSPLPQPSFGGLGWRGNAAPKFLGWCSDIGGVTLKHQEKTKQNTYSL